MTLHAAPSAVPPPADDELVPLERHRRDVLARIGPLEPLQLNLNEAHGCVLAEDVVANEDVPSFRSSAMDGYAVDSAAVVAGEPLDVVGEASAGAAASLEVAPGTAVRIMTGAPVPEGADAVIPVELAEEDGGRVRFSAPPRPGQHVRPRGESVTAGTTVLPAGHRLRAGDVGMLAAVGRASVRVHPRPRVAVISTGDELVEPDAVAGPASVRDANSYMLVALARECGATTFRHPIVPDDRRLLLEAFEGALSHADLLVTSGGVSAGRYDLVKVVLAQLGDVAFTRVAMQPGMPQAFGFIGGVPVFGLPGNPVSAYVSFEVFVRPALRRLQGRRDLNRPRVTAVLDDPLRSPRGKVSFLRVKLRRADDGWHATSTGEQGSGILRSVVDADGLAEVPADRTDLQPGERIVVHLLVEPQ